MASDKRLSQIEAIVNQEGFITTKDLARKLSVTETTIRRNSEELEKQGKVMRVHGGIKSLNPLQILSPTRESAMALRSTCSPEKEAAARKAASFVKDGDCIFLDVGSSIVPMIHYLKGKRVKIITHSHLLINCPEISEAQLYMLGGWYSPNYHMNFGNLIIEQLDFFNFDWAFLSCAGLDIEQRSAYTSETESAEIKRKAAQRAVRTMLLADSSKVGVRGFYNALRTDKLDGVICAYDESKMPRESDLPDNYIIVQADADEDKDREALIKGTSDNWTPRQW